MRISVKKKTLLNTNPVYIVASYDEKGTPNIMSAAWGGICCSDPPCLTISLRKATYTYHNIMARKAFTVNIPSIGHIESADYAGIYSGRDENKFESTGLRAIKSEYVDAPFVDEYPIAVHCKLIYHHEIGLHTQFVGEIISLEAKEEYLDENNAPDIAKVKPFIYDCSSRSYYSIGSKAMKAYSAIKK